MTDADKIERHTLAVLVVLVADPVDLLEREGASG